MLFRRLHHFTLLAPKNGHELARWFYGTVLGLKEINPPEKLTGIYDIIWFKLDNVVIHINFTEHYVKPEYFSEGEKDFSDHVAIEVCSIEDVRKKLEEHGIPTRAAVKVQDRERFYISDPFGMQYEILEMLIPAKEHE